MTNENIDLNKQYELFMAKIGIDLTALSADKKESSKRLFYAGANAMLDIVQVELPRLESKLELLESMKDINDQINNFWKAEQSINDVRGKLLNSKGAKLYKVGDEG
jgi:hypothetical protein